MTESVFDISEDYLRDSADAQKALTLFKTENPQMFRSLFDWLYCSIFPEWRIPCWNFYLTDKWQLRDILKPKQICCLDKAMLLCIKAGEAVLVNKIKTNPIEFHITYRDLIEKLIPNAIKLSRRYSSQKRFMIDIDPVKIKDNCRKRDYWGDDINLLK